MGQIVFADMNGDGKPDLVSLGSNNSQGDSELAISLGNGDGTFQTPTIARFWSQQQRRIRARGGRL